MPENIVYFLGAGASKNFGYPLTDEIMPEILKNLKNNDLFQLSDRKSAGEKRNENVLLENLYKLYPGLKEADINDPDLKKKIPGITEILSIVDHFCFYNTPPHPQIADGQLTEFRNLLNRAIGELILDYELKAFTQKEGQLFKKFIDPIRYNKKYNAVTIITTNYDLLIDTEFEDQLRKNKIDYGICYRHVATSELIFRDPKPAFHYYKLHGSLNWLRCDLCGQYYMNPAGSIVGRAFKEKIDDANTCICSDDLRLKSVLVAPSLVRDIRDPNLLQIWKAAVEAIRTASKLVMIGYSLPPEDLGIRSVIMRGLNGRCNNTRKLKVDVVQLGDAAYNNYFNLFGSDMKYDGKGLEHYLSQNRY